MLDFRESVEFSAARWRALGGSENPYGDCCHQKASTTTLGIKRSGPTMDLTPKPDPDQGGHMSPSNSWNETEPGTAGTAGTAAAIDHIGPIRDPYRVTIM